MSNKRDRKKCPVDLAIAPTMFTLKLLWEVTITGTNMQQKGRAISGPALGFGN
jgi:hypothetical protein